MQVDNYSSQGFRYKPFSAEMISSHTDLPINPQSPVAINKNLLNKAFDNTPLTDPLFFKSLNSDTSFPKFRPDSSSQQTFQNQYTHQSTTNTLNRPSFNKDSSSNLATFLKKISTSDISARDQFSIQFKSNTQENLLELDFKTRQNQSLKRENAKLTETVSKLRKDLDEKVVILKKFNELVKIKYAELKDYKAKLEQKEQLILKFDEKCSKSIDKEEAARLKDLLMRKNKELDKINTKINNLDNENFKNEIFQMKITKLYEDLEDEKSKVSHYFLQNSVANQKIKELEEQIVVLQFEKQKSSTIGKVAEIQQIQNLFKTPESSPSKSNRQSIHLTAFEEALRVQMKQIEELKQVIDNSTDAVQKLRDNLVSSRRELEQLRGEMRILDLKATSERKKLIMEYRLQLHQKDNKISTVLKKYKTLEQKYKNALIEIKAKDGFFKQYLVGRTTESTVQESIESILKQYTEDFEGMIALKTENTSLKQKLEKYQRFEEEIEKP